MPPSTPNEKDSSPQVSATRVDISGGNIVHAPHGTVIFNPKGNTEVPKALWSHSASDALHTSTAVSRHDSCTLGTRTVTLGNLESLATKSDPGSPDVIWLHGAAGAGKSAIMRTLANTLDERGFLLASFFFFRSDTHRNTSRFFIPTLAEQVWCVLPAARDNIFRAIQETPNLFSRAAHRQSPHLLEQPLLAALTLPGTPLTIIVDGLDECADQGGQTEIINAMIELASAIRKRANRRVKIFIASRPEYEIKSRFDASASDPAITVVRLDDSDANVHLFYDEQFEKIRDKFGLPSSWPSMEEIAWLMDKTSGQYSFARVSTQFMYGGDPSRRLKIIQEALKDDTLRPFDALDQLYATILDQIPGDMRIPAVRILRCRLHPLWHISDNRGLEPLLQLPPGYVHSLRSYLASLIDFDNKLASYHASLADFLADPSRSKKFSLYIPDRALSYTVQRGILAGFIGGEQYFSRYSNNNNEESPPRLFFFWGQDFLHDVVVPYPLPCAELTLALKRIDPFLLGVCLSRDFLRFLIVLRRQFQSNRLYIRHPILWYTIRYALPHQLRM